MISLVSIRQLILSIETNNRLKLFITIQLLKERKVIKDVTNLTLK